MDLHVNLLNPQGKWINFRIFMSHKMGFSFATFNFNFDFIKILCNLVA